ncbi:hypothetical protein [Mycolicibacter longobardus]|nr:hypothetical protein [Mycolicibacter longobardus]
MSTGRFADACILWSGYDISGVASNYQHIGGILAGFTFASITMVLDRFHRSRISTHPPDAREIEYEKLTGIALVSAFLGLLFASFQYGILAGERGCALTAGRAASEELLGDVMFAASIYILIYGLVQLSANSAVSLAKHARFIVVVLVPAIAVSFAEIKLMDLAISLGSEEEQQPLQPLWDHANRLAAPIGLTVMAVCGLMWLLGAQRRRAEPSPGRTARAAQTALPYLTIAFVICARIRSVVALPTVNPEAHITPGEGWLWVSLLTAVVLVQSMALSFQKGSEHVDADDAAAKELRPAGPA